MPSEVSTGSKPAPEPGREENNGAAGSRADPRSLDLGLASLVDPKVRYAADRWNLKEKAEYLLFGRRRAPGPSFTGLVEAPSRGKIGIACSGGGIRSASFNLGALQALQREEILERSRYLSGVSGGSYIAAAFCLVRKSWGEDDSDEGLIAKDPPFAPGSPEEQYLRNRSSYLAPGLINKLALAWRVLLGLGVNLSVVGLFLVVLAVPLAAAYGAIYPTLGRSLTVCNTPGTSCGFNAWPPPAGVWIPIAAALVLGLVLGVASLVAFRWPSWMHDLATTWSLRLLLATVAGGLILVGMPELLALVRALGEHREPVAPAAEAKATAAAAVAITGGGVTTVAVGVLLTLRADWLDVRTAAKKAIGATDWYSGLGQRLRRLIALAIAVVVGPLLALALVLLVMSAMLNLEDAAKLWTWAGIFAAVLAIVYALTDLTSWSLHPFYRRRLASAFALKRVARGRDDPPIGDPDVGVARERDYDSTLPLSSTSPPAGKEVSWPTLLVCAAANISDDAATPPGRSVTSFTFSAGSVGGPLIGAVETQELEEVIDRYQRARITVPAAVAMSGAALSPSMGKMTRRPLTMLIALANVRLGVWVPNPRRLSDFEDHGSPYPRPRPFYLLRELFGRNPLNSRFLYVTDGGHYENLGVLELLRRGCTEIFAFDASNDSFDALGDLVSLARSELDVKIDIDTADLRPGKKKGISKTDCVRGTITYPDADRTEGRFYYARPVITRSAPADVQAYHRQDERFPHDPTGDQLYTDQRFEAYRVLGFGAGENAVARYRAGQGS
jgi:hypothetical protein